MNVHTRWTDTSRDMPCIAWARRLYDQTATHAAGSVDVNFMPSDDDGRMTEAYGPNIDRLRQIKAKNDPKNRIRLIHNLLVEKIVDT